MGGGIAYVTACKGGLPVRIKDIQPGGINHALKYSWDLLNKQVRQRRLRPSERDRQLRLWKKAVTKTFDWVDDDVK